MPRSCSFQPTNFYIGAKLQVMKRVNMESDTFFASGISLMIRNRNSLF